MQVQSFVPFRSTGISPPSFPGWSTMVAFFAIARGAALIAFWTFHAFVLPAGWFPLGTVSFCDALWALPTVASASNRIFSTAILLNIDQPPSRIFGEYSTAARMEAH